MPIFEEDYRYYPLMKPIIVNGYEFKEIIISSHYEENHKYLTDKDILEIVQQLNNENFDFHRERETNGCK